MIASSVIFALWNASYLSRSPINISIVSLGVGSPTFTGWKRRSRAASFSIYFLYSFNVVAPMHLISPLARAGFIILAASMEPSPAPAPTRVCNSSINRIQFSCFFTSSKTFFNRSSNSPLYFVPATTEDIFKEMILQFFKISGTSLLIIRCAKPSAIAVFPTPGSPIRTGLFLFLRERI